MGHDARPQFERTSCGAAGHRTHVRAWYLSATCARRDQQNGGANGRATEILATDELNMLAWTIYISFIGVAVLMLLPRGNARAARTVALLAAGAGFVIASASALQAEPGAEIE